MFKKIWLTVIFVLFVLSACAGKPQKNAEATDVPTVAMKTAVPAGLSLPMIEQASIYAPQLQKTVQLTDGKYEAGTGADYALVQVLPQAALGDLNGDGVQDAAVLLAENSGGSGVFVSLVALVSNGSGFTQSQAVLIDDRPQINGVGISAGQISIDAVVHGENDPMVSPTLKVLETYQLSEDALTLVGLKETSGSSEHSIVIDLPKMGDAVSGDVEVSGSMPVAPFENGLRYRFYDTNEKVLDEGAFTVKSADVGQPATFDTFLTLPQVSEGTKMRLELSELSAKDGSPMCITSVWVSLK